MVIAPKTLAYTRKSYTSSQDNNPRSKNGFRSVGVVYSPPFKFIKTAIDYRLK